MPVNLIHSMFHRVENGWDPITREYSQEYDEFVTSSDPAPVVNRVAQFMGGLQGKSVLDLGGGPAHFSVLLAERGARVVWHDVSKEYQKLAERRAKAAGVTLQFSLGYLETARRFAPNSFDLLFCRVCWYYCRNDRRFASLIYSLIKPGGTGYIECSTPAFSPPRGHRRLQYWLNGKLWWKIGHPYPPHGRIASLIQRYPVSYMELDYRSNLTDVVLFVK
ncbi:MAG TPA: class I SAM-dependent methyltransferase [Candidatus Acidoferrum sp.]|nr:class I SAM-dependent methyltransferase [Candidatus Acidoferrum sp.]